MPTVDILSPAGEKAGSVDLPDDVFDVQTNIPLIHQVVVGQLAAARQGTASTKTRGEVRGGGRKPHKQKGTGRARQGSTRAPQFVGGGVVHGPKPRDYSQRTPKKMKAAALRGALSDRARFGRIHVFSALVEGEKPSTKAAWAILDGLSERKNLLVVVDRNDTTSWSSLRNLENVHVLVPDQLNTYDVLCADDIVFTEGSLSTFLAGPTKGRSEKDEAVDAVQDAPTADRAATTEDVSVKAEPATTEGAGAEAADEQEDNK
jgi:large subunit ribosomal protein L4